MVEYIVEKALEVIVKNPEILDQYCRIIDPNNIRRAWGGMDAMEKIFRKLAESN